MKFILLQLNLYVIWLLLIKSISFLNITKYVNYISRNLCFVSLYNMNQKLFTMKKEKIKIRIKQN
ncbi:hypothetical protein KAOT1_19257 [Kordia algicida OT-1]|uniref:Uncharacterized protein n=1 Tax=Kordia algicida OT-1 TaxID=391587 RepID=A9DP13_9FLAO|nr:hypothetical protein KAOT1_19257 [Kordia algicida OT-1]